MSSEIPFFASIKTRFILVYTALVGLIALFIYLFIPYKLEYQLLKSLESRANSIAHITAFHSIEGLLDNDERQLQDAISGAIPNTDLLYVVVHNKDGEVIASHNLQMAETSTYNVVVSRVRLSLNQDLYKIHLPIQLRENSVGNLFMGFSILPLRADAKATRQMMGLVSLAIFMLGFVLISMVTSVLTHPLNKLVQAVQSVAASGREFSVHIKIKSQSEFGHLARSFNKMMYNLQKITNDLEEANGQLKLQNSEMHEQKVRLEEVNTELEITNETMRKQEARLTAILENFSGEIWSIDRSYEILICNSVFLQEAEFRGALIGVGDNAIDPQQGDKYCERWKQYYDRALSGDCFSQVAVKITEDREEYIEYVFNPIITYNEIVGVAVLGIDVTQRKTDEEEKNRLNQELNETARRAGMADVAASVLHNVGNVLTSVTTSVSMIDQTITHSRLNGFFKANKMLRSNFNHIDKFIEKDPRGKKLLNYYLMLEDQLKNENHLISKNLDRLQDKVNIINEVIAAQQSYATGSMLSEALYLPDVIDDALKLQGDSTDRHHIDLVQDYADDIPLVNVQRTKLIHILVNLYRNAKDALQAVPLGEKRIHIKLFQQNNEIVLQFSDSGCGIPKENLERIFNHGFTTKPSGHGFGLHSCANYMTEMGGRISLEKKGAEKGATFALYFPMVKEKLRDLTPLLTNR